MQYDDIHNVCRKKIQDIMGQTGMTIVLLPYCITRTIKT